MQKNLFLQTFEVWTLSEYCNLPEGIPYPFYAWVDIKSVILFISVEWEEKHLKYVFKVKDNIKKKKRRRKQNTEINF